MSRKNGIDLFRFIGAFLIICLHANYGNLSFEYVNYLRLLARWVVPFFFIATGFFMGNKIDNGNLDFQRIQNNISMLITVLIVSSIIYIPINLLKGPFNYNIETILIGTHFHLWFIGSLLLGYIFIWYLYFIKKYNILPYISGLILILAIFTDSYDQFLGKNIPFDFFRFLLCIPFMYIGISLSKSDYRKFGKKRLIGLSISGIVIQIFEVDYFKSRFGYSKYLHQFLIGTIVISIALFIFSSIIDIKESKLTKWGKKYSLFIYLYHPIVLSFITQFTNKVFPSYAGSILIFSSIIGFILILTAAILLNKFIPKVYSILNGDLLVKTDGDNVKQYQKQL